MASRRQEFLAGSKDVFPLAVGVASLMTVWGAVALSAGIPAWIAQFMTLTIFAGSQFLMAQLIAVGTPAGMIIVASSLVNLRHLLYSASVAPFLKDLHPLWKGVLAYLLTDESFAVSNRHYQQHSRDKYTHWYVLGAGLTVWAAAQISTALGLFLGTHIPSTWSLDFTATLALIALIVPTLKERACGVSALTAGIVAVALAALPLKLGLLVATAVGIVSGLIAHSDARSLTDALAYHVWRWARHLCYAGLVYCTRQEVRYTSAPPTRLPISARRYSLRPRVLAGVPLAGNDPLQQWPTTAGRLARSPRRLPHQERSVDHQRRHGNPLAAPMADQPPLSPWPSPAAASNTS
jgi:predicted branched-subunit amino acid permease